MDSKDAWKQKRALPLRQRRHRRNRRLTFDDDQRQAQARRATFQFLPIERNHPVIGTSQLLFVRGLGGRWGALATASGYYRQRLRWLCCGNDNDT